MKAETRAFWLGLILVALQTLSAVLANDVFSFYSLVFPLGAAILTFASRNLPGVGWTVAGQLGANLAAFVAAHPTPDGLTGKYILSAWVIPWIIQALGVFGAKAEPETN